MDASVCLHFFGGRLGRADGSGWFARVDVHLLCAAPGPQCARFVVLAGLNSQEKIERVKYALERLRWLPNTLGDRHVFINQPEFRARYINGGNEALSMRVVVGKKSNQTNVFHRCVANVLEKRANRVFVLDGLM